MGEDEKFTSADDLIYIEENTDAAIVKKLNDRFTKDQIYSRIGEDILVSVNPNRPLELNAEGNTKAYNISLKEGYDRDPHVFELAASTYYQMKETKLDHSMVFLYVFSPQLYFISSTGEKRGPGKVLPSIWP